MSSYQLLILATAAVVAIEVLAMNVIAGYAGQLSLAQAAIMGAGAYGFAIATSRGVPVVGAIAIALALAVSCGVIAAGPAVRLRRDYFVIASLGLAEVATVVETNVSITGGVYGISVKQFVPEGKSLAIVSLSALVVIFAFTRWLCLSPIGSVLLAVRADEQAARGVGIDVTRVKLGTFALSSVIAAIGGILYTQLAGYIDPTEFDFPTMILILIPWMISGRRNLFLGVVATAGITWLQQVMASTPAASGILLGGLLVIGIAIEGAFASGRLVSIRSRLDSSRQFARERLGRV
jgi:branched-chain amino acid transport system permease protein